MSLTFAAKDTTTGSINQADRWLPVRFRTFYDRRRTPWNASVRPTGVFLSFVIRGLPFALDWQKSCCRRNQSNSGFTRALACAL